MLIVIGQSISFEVTLGFNLELKSGIEKKRGSVQVCTGKMKVCFIVLIKLSLRLINLSHNSLYTYTTKEISHQLGKTSKQSVSMHKRTSKQSVSERETSKQPICLHITTGVEP